MQVRCAQCHTPIELSDEVGVLDVLSVRAVDGAEDRLSNADAQKPRTELFLARQPDLSDFGFEAVSEQHRNAIPGLLAVAECLVPEVSKAVMGKQIVGHFDLL